MNRFILMTTIRRIHQDNIKLIIIRIIQKIMLQRIHVINIRYFDIMQKHIGNAKKIRKRFLFDTINTIIKLFLCCCILNLLL